MRDDIREEFSDGGLRWELNFSDQSINDLKAIELGIKI
jgi:hypothetical protein